MKNHIVFIFILGLIFSCGPSEQQVANLKNLLGEWETTSGEISKFSKELGDQMFLLETKKSEGQASESISISVNGDESTCETEYASLKENVDELISNWKESTTSAEELTTQMSSGTWTTEDDENLEALSDEAKKAKADVELWSQKLTELKTKCNTQSDTESS